MAKSGKARLYRAYRITGSDTGSLDGLEGASGWALAAFLRRAGCWSSEDDMEGIERGILAANFLVLFWVSRR
jgi:hypothetical protein